MTATRLSRLVRDEQGFTMIVTMGVLLIVVLFSVAAFAAADGDIKPGADDKESKSAYSAAEAGVNDYLARLIADTDYWRKCSDLSPGGAPNHLGLNLANPVPIQRRWMQIPGSTAQYSIEVLPANGATQCDPNNAQATVIDTKTGTFRVRATGRAYAASRKRRSIVATFRRKGFLDYIYFTDFETQNPSFYARNRAGLPTRENGTGRSLEDWAEDKCAKYYHEDRALERFNGERFVNGAWEPFVNRPCEEISFAGQDAIRGPMHSNDSIAVCQSPTFGRRPTDEMEVSGPQGHAGAGDKGWRQTCGSGAPQVNYPGTVPPVGTLGTWRQDAPLLKLPPSNSSLKDDALPAYRFRGKTTIVLNGTSMTVTGKRYNGAPLANATLPIPADGVISVLNDSGSPACIGYNPLQPLTASATCGDVWVRGTYARSLTITAENDIVVDEDVLRSGDHLLGLISNNFIRVHHPTTNDCGPAGGGTNDGGPGSLTIEAAILSLTNSFTVDRWWCGAQVGTVTVIGAIAQKFRGTVGRIGTSGYLKDYQYDDRLRFRSPPRFLDPVQAAWRILTYVEQVPPAQ